MSTRTRLEPGILALLPVLLLAWPAMSNAQVPVDEDGNPIGTFDSVDERPATGDEDIPLLTATELEELVGPIALYPDDLLAIVLPASAYPLQIVQAGRFLEALDADPTLEPDEDWDDSVVALINYPEVVRLLNDDLDWTWRLGEAVVAQQADVIAAVETFRDRAYAAGNLKSDERQTISRDEGYIEITPVDDDVIYVPYYEPERVIEYQRRPVYYYYPDPCPVYYYPYPSSYAFHRGFFWGVTTAFTVGWHTDRLRVFHHSYYGHPYYGRYYWPRWRYRQPTVNVYNNIYVNRFSNRTRDYYRAGDEWQPRNRRTVRISDRRVTRSRNYRGNDATTTPGSRNVTRSENRHRVDRANLARREDGRSDIKFRNRPKIATGTPVRVRSADERSSVRRASDRRDASDRANRDKRRRDGRSDIESRSRPKLASGTPDSARSVNKRSIDRRETQRRTQVRPTQSRKSDTRRHQVQRQDVRRSEPRPSQRRHEPKSKKSGSVKLASGSRQERANDRDRRR